MKPEAQGYVKTIIETLSVFFIAILAVALIRYNELPGSSLLIPLVWCLGALLPGAGQVSVISLAGLAKPHLAIGLRYYLLSSLIIFPVIAMGFLLCQWWGMPLPTIVMPPGVSIEGWVLYQFAAVGVFEELFFRAYVQKQIETIAGTAFASTTVIFWFPILASALLFAVAHVVVELDPFKLVTFFPGLLFAWLWAKTGTLLAPVLSHGSVNVLYLFLSRLFS